MSELLSFVQMVKIKISEELTTDPWDIEEQRITRFIMDAVIRYNKIKPKSLVYDFTGDGVVYEFGLPASWSEGYSSIVAVEYPVGQQVPSYMQPSEYALYQGTAEKKFRLLETVPGSGDAVRVTFTAPFRITADASDIPEQDEVAIADLAASMCFKELAAKYARTQRSTLEGEVLNYLTKVDYYIRLAQQYEANFNAHFGIATDGSPPGACEIGDWDQTYEWGEPFIVHRPEWR